jgi:hypothetical protein
MAAPQNKTNIYKILHVVYGSQVRTSLRYQKFSFVKFMFFAPPYCTAPLYNLHIGTPLLCMSLRITGAPREFARSGWAGREGDYAHAHYATAKHFLFHTYCTDLLQVTHVLFVHVTSD